MVGRTLAIVGLAWAEMVYPCDASQALATKRLVAGSSRALPHQVVLDRNATLFTSSDEGEPIQKAAKDRSSHRRFGASHDLHRRVFERSRRDSARQSNHC